MLYNIISLSCIERMYVILRRKENVLKQLLVQASVLQEYAGKLAIKLPAPFRGTIRRRCRSIAAWAVAALFSRPH